MYYTVYKVTNKIDGKFYIGVHQTNNLNDGYMGSGKYLKRAQEKYGIENFEKEILHVFDNPEEMFAKEAEIVNEDFLALENTYNLKVGGFGGWDHLNSDPNIQRARAKASNKSQRLLRITEPERYLRSISSARSNFKNAHSQGKIRYDTFRGKKHSEESRKKMSESQRGKHSGTKNSQYGTMWIHSLQEKKSKKIPKDSPIPKGWIKGRRIKF